MSDLLFKNALLATADAVPQPADVQVADGRIQAVGRDLKPAGRVIDCTGKIVLPGLFDMHVHLREPGGEDRESIQSGTEAAINGGITGLLAMPNTQPPIDIGGMVTFVANMARTHARIPVSVAGCLTAKREGSRLAEIADMADQGAVMVTDSNHPVRDAYVLRRALEYTRHFNVVVGVFPDTPDLTGDGVMHEGEASFRYGLTGIPAMSEEIAIERDLRIAQATGGRLHIQNVSTAGGVESIRRFKQAGVRVTAEVTPHHLLLTAEDICDYNTYFKMLPPLRSDADRAALLAGLLDGTLDVIASGHAPHTEFEKNMDFRSAPFGVVGVETALLCLFSELIAPGELGWNHLVRAFCDRPRELLNLPPAAVVPGNPANLVLFNPEVETLVDRGFLRSQSCNSPWLGRSLRGCVEMVVLGDQILLERAP